MPSPDSARDPLNPRGFAVTRPTTVESPEEAKVCPKIHRVTTSIDVVRMFMAITRARMIRDLDGSPGMVRPCLTPKEEALYAAALDRLERYIDQET